MFAREREFGEQLAWVQQCIGKSLLISREHDMNYWPALSLSTRAIATMMMNFLLMQVYNLLMMWMILCVHCWMEYAGFLLLCWRRNGWCVHGKWIIMLRRREKSSWACAASVAADIRLVLIVYSICLKFNVCMLHCTIFTMMPSTICGL